MTRRTVERRAFLAATASAVVLGGIGSVTADDGYDRKYEPIDDPRLDFGAVYIPFLGSKWGRCVDHEPTVGQYGITDEHAVNRHIDQMQGHGISTLLFNFGEGPKDLERYRTFQQAELASEINIEAFYVINRVFQRDLDLDRHLDFIRDEMFAHPRYNTIDGRPVVQFWASNYIPWHDPTVEEVREEYGGLTELATHIYDRLTVDGTRPYIVANVNDVPPNGLPERQARWNRQFDALNTWFAKLDEGTTDWEAYVERTEEDFELLAEFTTNNDMDFVPTAFPGFDDTYNDCWGGDRLLPRNQEQFASILELTDTYRTREKVNLATYNDWTEGHQVEPGTFDDTDYGTAYLDSIKSFQTQSSDSGATVTSTATPTTSETTPPATSEVEPPTTETMTDTRTSTTTTFPSDNADRTTRMANEETTESNESGTSVPGFGILAGLAGGSLAAYQSRTSGE